MNHTSYTESSADNQQSISCFDSNKPNSNTFVEILCKALMEMPISTAQQPWHDTEAHAEPRRAMEKKILDMILEHRKNSTEEYRRRVHHLAAAVENHLYERAPGIDEYSDEKTLVDRLAALLKEKISTRSIPLGAFGWRPSDPFYNLAQNVDLINSTFDARNAQLNAEINLHHVSSQGCSRVFILKVLNMMVAHFREFPTTASIFTNLREKIAIWLDLARNECASEEGMLEERERHIYGGAVFNFNSPATFWTEPSQLICWWKNNVERKNKLRELLEDSLYRGPDVKKRQRALWCEGLITRINQIKENIGGPQRTQVTPDMARPNKIKNHGLTTSGSNVAVGAPGNGAITSRPSPSSFAPNPLAPPPHAFKPQNHQQQQQYADNAGNNESSFSNQRGDLSDPARYKHYQFKATDKAQTFALVLFDLVSDENEMNLVWILEGRAFSIVDPHLFVNEVLPRVFEVDTIAFQQLLALHGFQVHTIFNRQAFSHPLFVQGRRDMAHLINIVPSLPRPSTQQSAASSTTASASNASTQGAVDKGIAHWLPGAGATLNGDGEQVATQVDVNESTTRSANGGDGMALFPPPVNLMQLPSLPSLPPVGEISVPSLLMGIPPLIHPQQQQQPQQHYVSDGFGNFVPTFPPSFYSYAHNLFGTQDAQYMYMTWWQQLQALAASNGFGFDSSTTSGSRRSNRANAGNASAQFYEDYATEHLQLRGERRVKLPSATDSMATHSRLNFKKRPSTKTVCKSEDGREAEVEETVNLNRSNNRRGMHLHSAKKIAQQQRQQQRIQRARDGFEKFHEGDQDGEEGTDAPETQQFKRPRRANAGRPMQRALASLNQMEVDYEAEIQNDIETARDLLPLTGARSTRKRSRPSTAATSEIDLGEIEEEGRPPVQGRKRYSGAAMLIRNASLQSLQQVQAMPSDAVVTGGGASVDSDEDSDDPDDDPELDLRQPRRRRLFIDFTALSNNSDAHSSRNSPSKSSSVTKEEYYIYGTTHGKLLNAAARRSFFLALQAPDNVANPDQEEQPTATATSSTSRRRQPMISRVGEAPVQRHSRVGDDYQAAIPAWRPRRPNSASSAGRISSGSLVSEESGLVWSPSFVKGIASNKQKDIELQAYLNAAIKIERDKRCEENANGAPFAAGELCFAMLPAENDGEAVEEGNEVTKDFRLCTILGPTFDPTPAAVTVAPEPVEAEDKSVARRLSRQRKAAFAPSVTPTLTIPTAAAMKASPIWMRVFDGSKVHTVHESSLLRPGDILREEIHLQLLSERQGDIKATLKTLRELPGLVTGPEEQLFASQRWTFGDVKKFCAAIRRFNDHPRKIWQSQLDDRDLRDVLAFFLSVQPRLMQAGTHPASRLLSIYRRADRAAEGLSLDDDSSRVDNGDEDGDDDISEGDAGQALLTEDDRYYRVSSVPIVAQAAGVGAVKSATVSANGSEAGDSSTTGSRSRGRPRSANRQRRESEPPAVEVITKIKLQESIEDESSTAPEEEQEEDDDVSDGPYPPDHFRRTTRSSRPSTADSIPTVESVAIKEEVVMRTEGLPAPPQSRPRSSNPGRGTKVKGSSPGHQLLWSEAEAALHKRRGTAINVDEMIIDDTIAVQQEAEVMIVTSEAKNKRSSHRRSNSTGRKSTGDDEDEDPDMDNMQVESSVVTSRRTASRSISSAETTINTSNAMKVEVKKEIMASASSAAAGVASVAVKVTGNCGGATASQGHYGMLTWPSETEEVKSVAEDTDSLAAALQRKRGRPPRSTTPPNRPEGGPPLPPVLSAGAIAAIKAGANIRSNTSSHSGSKSKSEKSFKPCFCPRRFNVTDQFLACAAGHACAGWVHLKCAGLHTASEKTLQRCINFVCRGCRDAGADGEDDDAMDLESD